MRSGVVVLVAVAACHGPRGPRATPTTPQTQPVFVGVLPLSEPAEYEIARVSRAAGEQIFVRTGFGDPYKTGVPYAVFLALQRAFPDVLGANPEELADKFGFVPRDRIPTSTDLDVREGLPVGMHLTTDPRTGVAFLVTSCTLCHAERIEGKLVIGLANKRIRFHAYDRAFATVTTKEGFSATNLDKLARESAEAHQLVWPARIAEPLVAGVVRGLVQRAIERVQLDSRTTADPPGRIAALESFATELHDITGHDVPLGHDIGWAKIPDVIGFAQRTTQSWDGSGEGAMEMITFVSEIGAGVRVAWLSRHPLQSGSVGAFLRQPAARPRFPGPIDRALAEQGRARFDEHCARCHGHYSDDGRVSDYDDEPVGLDEVATDPARAQALTKELEHVANDPIVTRGFTRFHHTSGYVPPVLTNVWARGPYGHAGQWPNLATIATPPVERATRVVYAFGAPYDLQRVGISTHSPDTPLVAGDYLEDGSTPGFSVLGHPFLADLDAAARTAVLEFLKTL